MKCSPAFNLSDLPDSLIGEISKGSPNMHVLTLRGETKPCCEVIKVFRGKFQPRSMGQWDPRWIIEGDHYIGPLIECLSSHEGFLRVMRGFYAKALTKKSTTEYSDLMGMRMPMFSTGYGAVFVPESPNSILAKFDMWNGFNLPPCRIEVDDDGRCLEVSPDFGANVGAILNRIDNWKRNHAAKIDALVDKVKASGRHVRGAPELKLIGYNYPITSADENPGFGSLIRFDDNPYVLIELERLNLSKECLMRRFAQGDLRFTTTGEKTLMIILPVRPSEDDPEEIVKKRTLSSREEHFAYLDRTYGKRGRDGVRRH